MDVLLQARGWLLGAAAVLAGGHGAPARRAQPVRAAHRLQLGSNLSVSAQGAVVRTDSCWQCVEPAPGVWRWGYDNTLAHEFGPRWQPVLDYAPTWATPEGRTPPPGGWSRAALQDTHRNPPKPAGSSPAATAARLPGPAERLRRLRALRGHVGAATTRGWSRVWNEPDISVYWNPTQPARLRRKLYAPPTGPIKRVSPNTLVLGVRPGHETAAGSCPTWSAALHGRRAGRLVGAPLREQRERDDATSFASMSGCCARSTCSSRCT